MPLHTCMSTNTHVHIVWVGMLRDLVNKGQGWCWRGVERAREGPERCEGHKDGWSRLLIGAPCSQASLGDHTYLPDGRGPAAAFITGLTSALHLTKWRLPRMANAPSDLLLRKIKATGAGIRCHLVDGSDKYEGSCTPIIKRWEERNLSSIPDISGGSSGKNRFDKKSLWWFQVIDILTCLNLQNNFF